MNHQHQGMKQLVIKCMILFSAVCLPLWVYVFFFPKHVYHQEFSFWDYSKDVITGRAAADKTDILVLGDSRIMAGVLPQRLSGNAVSIALGGTTPLEAYYSLKRYLRNNSRPESILLSIAPVHFENRGSYRERTLKFNFLHPAEFLEVQLLRLDYKQPAVLDDMMFYALYSVRFPLLYLPELQKAVLKPRNELNRRAYKFRKDNSGYAPRGTALSVSYAAEKEEAYRKIFKADPINTHYFEQIMELCHRWKIRLIFETLPLNRATRQLIAAEYLSGYQSYINTAFSRYPEFSAETELPVYPDDCFGDPSHLNKRGAERYSNYARKRYFSNSRDQLAGQH